MLRMLVDADMFLYAAASAAEKDVQFDDIIHVFSSVSDAKVHFIEKLNVALEAALIKMKYTGDYEVLMCVSGNNNFRKEVLPSYKENRSGKRKPLCYYQLLEWMQEEYPYKLIDTLEADDLLGILSTAAPDHSVIISGDKDMRCLPVTIYNHLQDTLETVDDYTADYNFFYQTLVGDTTDNYKGCPKVGAVGAKKILDNDCSWEAVVAQFEKQGLTEEDAYQQAHVARILRAGEYEFKTGKVKLWVSE